MSFYGGQLLQWEMLTNEERSVLARNSAQRDTSSRFGATTLISAENPPNGGHHVTPHMVEIHGREVVVGVS